VNCLLDTNVVSELIARSPNPKVVSWIDAVDPMAVHLSVITIGEIRKGIEKLPASARKAELQTWLEHDLLLRFQGRIAPITTETMLRWGELVGRLEMRGRSLTAIDSLIAASALEHGFRLATRNVSDFADTGVALVNPWE
jgi:tRNA(fMet)-specific endonuclease VapC